MRAVPLQSELALPGPTDARILKRLSPSILARFEAGWAILESARAKHRSLSMVARIAAEGTRRTRVFSFQRRMGKVLPINPHKGSTVHF